MPSVEEVELARWCPATLGVALTAARAPLADNPARRWSREAIEVLAGPDTRLEQARAQADLGALLAAPTAASRLANGSGVPSTPPITSAPPPG